MRKKIIGKMIAGFAIDLAIAGGIVGGYYYMSFYAPKKPSSTEQIVIGRPSESALDENDPDGESFDESEMDGQEAVATQENASADVSEESALEPVSEATGEVSETLMETTFETTPDVTEEPTTEDGIERRTWTDKFLSHFSKEPVQTVSEDGMVREYKDQHVDVTVTQVRKETDYGAVTYYLADIYVADISYLQTGLIDDGTMAYTFQIEPYTAQHPQNVLITNGDYYSKVVNGFLVRNGKVYRDSPSDVEQCGIGYDGVMHIYGPTALTMEVAQQDGIWQSWCFGPSLLSPEGEPLTSFYANEYLYREHPRTALGYYEPGHYCLLLVEGREEGYSRGMTLEEMSQLFYDLGCTAAYNMDGGGSSVMSYRGEVVGHQKERWVSDFIVINSVTELNQ